MSKPVPVKDLDEKTRKVIEQFSNREPSVEGLPNTVVLRDKNGNVLGHYLLSKAPSVNEIQGAVAFRVDKNDGRIQFCDDYDAVRKFLGLPQVFMGVETPESPEDGDFWVDEGE